MITVHKKTDILPNTGLVLLDFWSSWCAPCKMLAKIIDEVNSKLNDTPTIIKINTDEFPLVASEFAVRSLPTLVLLNDGKVIKILCGFQKEDVLIQLLSPEE